MILVIGVVCCFADTTSLSGVQDLPTLPCGFPPVAWLSGSAFLLCDAHSDPHKLPCYFCDLLVGHPLAVVTKDLLSWKYRADIKVVLL